MIQYNFNLINESENRRKRLRTAAERAARAASAVDTGLYKRSWHAFMQGNVLVVRNRIRYSAFVELGTIHSKKHQFKIRNALRRIGLQEGVVRAFDVQAPIPQEGNQETPGQEQTPATVVATGIQIIPASTSPSDVIPLLAQQRQRAIAPTIQAVSQRQQFLTQRSSFIKRFTTIAGLAALIAEEDNEIQNTEE